jgi:hypothetical protein
VRPRDCCQEFHRPLLAIAMPGGITPITRPFPKNVPSPLRALVFRTFLCSFSRASLPLETHSIRSALRIAVPFRCHPPSERFRAGDEGSAVPPELRHWGAAPEGNGAAEGAGGAGKEADVQATDRPELVCSAGHVLSPWTGRGARVLRPYSDSRPTSQFLCFPYPRLCVISVYGRVCKCLTWSLVQRLTLHTTSGSLVESRCIIGTKWTEDNEWRKTWFANRRISLRFLMALIFELKAGPVGPFI